MGQKRNNGFSAATASWSCRLFGMTLSHFFFLPFLILPLIQSIRQGFIQIAGTGTPSTPNVSRNNQVFVLSKSYNCD
jgi:hypothetical protein